MAIIYSATRKAKGKRQKARVYYNSFSAFINVLSLMRSAIYIAQSLVIISAASKAVSLTLQVW
ncbi:hypothetical protein [Moorena producens]|uniref:hypothetical protein n=1 Tax=Moorena producens TaxID=1155739 RepID=UPI003C75AE52